MGRNLSPVLQRELANLDKGADSRKSAMKALKSYVKDLDSKAIPQFLAQVSETKETGSLSSEYTISLYEVLARVHGINIVPQIETIMATIIKTLASSAGSFPLQQACSKVIPAIARYGIDPTTPEDKKRHIIHSLCKPLSEALLSSQESLTSGAALCLKALVEIDNWRFASDEMVNRVCQNLAVALEEKSTQSNSHVGLAMALAKHNALIVEAYARLLINSGLHILNTGVLEGNSQKRLSAIQMVNFLMKCLDPRSTVSGVDLIIQEMDRCQSDQMAYVSGAAFEALQTAKKISLTGSNLVRRDYRGRVSPGSYSPCSISPESRTLGSFVECYRGRVSPGSYSPCSISPESRTLGSFVECYRGRVSPGSYSPCSISPESQTLGSFVECDSLVESPDSATQISHNRKLCSYENGGVDVSLRDGLFSELANGSPLYDEFSGHSSHHENGECVPGFDGFLSRNSRNGLRSTTPSPQRPRSHVNDNNTNIFTTPRKLIRSLQEPSNVDSGFFEKQSRRFRSPCSSKFYYSPSGKGFQHGEVEQNGHVYSDNERFQDSTELVSSIDDVQVSQKVSIEESQRFSGGKKHWRYSYRFIVGLLFALLALFTSLLLIDNRESQYLVPT